MKKDIYETLELLYPMESLQTSQKRFIGQRRKKVIGMGCVMVILGIFWIVSGKGAGEIMQGNRLQRPDFGSRNITLMAQGGDYRAEISCEVPHRSLSTAETEEMLERIQNELPELMRAENPSLREVTQRLNLPSSLTEYGFELVWYSSDNRVLSADGEIHNQELTEPVEVCLTARVSYEAKERQYQYDVCILPYPYSAQERFFREVDEAVKNENRQSAQKEYLELPEKVGDVQLTWAEKKTNYAGVLAILGALLLYLVYAREGNLLKQRLEKRNEELMLDYPDFLSQFLLLLGSGMNVRGIWERMAADYRKRGKKRFVYEEMLRALAQMEVGLPESRAYEQFGRRCGLLPYLRFSGILVQNLRKGCSGIAQHLQGESAAAFAERKAAARRKGEKAGTKLLLPMGGMLVLVFAIILIPAFSSFQM